MRLGELDAAPFHRCKLCRTKYSVLLTISQRRRPSELTFHSFMQWPT